MFSEESHGIINAITLKLKIIDMVVTMKIGEFAKKYDIPISTVRYYIDENLITPKKTGPNMISANTMNLKCRSL